MFRARQIKIICLIIMVSVLLMGMCPTGMVADSFFASSRSHTVTRDATRTLFRTICSTPRTVAYTQETLPEYETVLTPTISLRRVGLRQLARECYSIHGTSNILSFYSNTSGNHSGYLFIKNFSNTVIVNYIHHQDGAKA